MGEIKEDTHPPPSLATWESDLHKLCFYSTEQACTLQIRDNQSDIFLKDPIPPKHKGYVGISYSQDMKQRNNNTLYSQKMKSLCFELFSVAPDTTPLQTEIAAALPWEG